MNKTELINKFLEKADLKPHELVYWKYKVSNGFDLIKFMSDFLDYAQTEQLRIISVSERSSFENAMYWYLKGFEDSEKTESQPVSHEQTMKDAEAHFHLVWDCYLNAR